MKKLLLLLTLTFSSCEDEPKNERDATIIFIVYDLSNRLHLPPEAKAIIKGYNFEDYPDQAAYFRLALITDLQSNPTFDIYLPDKKESKKYKKGRYKKYRGKDIIAFGDTIKSAIKLLPIQVKGLGADTGSLDKSECYCTIIHQLNALSNLDARKKELWVMSDLVENAWFNAYKNEDIVAKSPDSIWRILSARCPIKRTLEGITVRFFYQPKTKIDEVRFFHMLEVYTNLQDYGAITSISSSFNTAIYEKFKQ